MRNILIFVVTILAVAACQNPQPQWRGEGPQSNELERLEKLAATQQQTIEALTAKLEKKTSAGVMANKPSTTDTSPVAQKPQDGPPSPLDLACEKLVNDVKLYNNIVSGKPPKPDFCGFVIPTRTSLYLDPELTIPMLTNSSDDSKQVYSIGRSDQGPLYMVYGLYNLGPNSQAYKVVVGPSYNICHHGSRYEEKPHEKYFKGKSLWLYVRASDITRDAKHTEAGERGAKALGSVADNDDSCVNIKLPKTLRGKEGDKFEDYDN